MDKTELYERTARDFTLLHICICICVTHQVYQYFCRDDIFRYDSLEDRTQIRLFRVDPGKYYEDITGHLYTVTMNQLEGVRYGAISYVWGDPHNTVGISVNADSGAGILSITKTLEAALRRVRRPTEGRLIWADGICINQTDVLERGHQVRLMRSIYEQANFVHVWLGSGSRECTDMYARCAFHLLKRFNGKSKDEEIDQRIAETDSKIWRNLSHILNQPWFRRIWILQEIGVAKKANFYYGRASIDRDALYQACYILATRIKDFPAITTLETPITWIKSLETHFQFNYSKNLLTISKFDLFDLARCCDATDPRDMVYALMGHPIFDTVDGKDFLPIDYSHSRERLYTGLSLKLLLEPRNPLQLLSLVKHTGSRSLGRDSLPTWVPSWDVKSPVQTLGDGKPAFAASKSKRQTFQASVDGICIQGHPVDTIEWQSHELRRTDFPEPREKAMMSSTLRSIIDAFTSVAIKPGSTNLRSCARTLVAADYYLDEQDAAPFSAQEQPQDTAIMFDFVEYVEALLKREVGRGTSAASIKTLQKVLARDCPDQQPRAGLNDRHGSIAFGGLLAFSHEARKWCTGRRFFITAKGRFGLGPPVSQVGDLVYILSGVAVPFVLRRNFSNISSDTQDVQLCGECYVDGIMQGEADRTMVEGDACLEKLRII